MKYLIANWKSNKKLAEVEKFFTKINKLYQSDKEYNLNSLEIVVCPPFVYLPLAKKMVERYKLPIKLGAQDVSPFQEGAYTGGVTASMLSEFVEYVIIGHSERRNYFKEGRGLLVQKVKKVVEAKLTPIFCIQSDQTLIPKEVKMVAFEPVEAIGTGKPETPERATQVAESVKKQNQNVNTVLYGGSVTPDNIKSFVATRHIDGVLVGGASLEGDKFWEMIVNVSDI